MAVNKTTDQSFEADILKNSNLTLVDFWAEWCGPCRVVGPILDVIADELAETVQIYKMNIDDNPETPGRFNVRSIPTLALFKNGEMVSQQVGALPRNTLIEWINKHKD